MDDIPLYLPAGARLTALTVYSDLSEYVELMQRAVVLLLTSEDPRMIVDGYTLPARIAAMTTAGVSSLESSLNHYADSLKSLLNADDPCVSDLTLAASGDRDITIEINITKIDDEQLTGEITL